QMPSQRKANDIDQGQPGGKPKRRRQGTGRGGDDFLQEPEIVPTTFAKQPGRKETRLGREQPLGKGRTARGTADVNPGKHALEARIGFGSVQSNFYIGAALAK